MPCQCDSIANDGIKEKKRKEKNIGVAIASKKRKMQNVKEKSEIQLQAECFQWAWNALPETRRLIFHVPNGGSRNVIEGMQLKASGVVPGIPDLLFIWHGQLHAFELKTATGTVSDAQAEVHFTWNDHGVFVHIVRTLESFQEHVKKIIQQ
jgi:hypothetical protein